MFLRVHRKKGGIQPLRENLEAYDKIRLKGNSQKSHLLRLQGGSSQSLRDIHLRQTAGPNGKNQAVQSHRHQTRQICSHSRQPSLQIFCHIHRSFLLHLHFNIINLPNLQTGLRELFDPPQHGLFPSRLHSQYFNLKVGLCILFEEMLWNS